MNRYSFYIFYSILLILFSIVILFYGYWDAGQPRIGPEGDGDHTPTFKQLFPIYCALLMGLINLPVAIMKYYKFIKAKELRMQEEQEDQS